MVSSRESPYDEIAEVPAFDVTSTDVHDGEKLPRDATSGIIGEGGSDISPQLSWSGFPAETKSFAVTMYDPDAPTASGFWHWAVTGIPATVTSLPRGAGDDTGSGLPDGARQLVTDGGLARYLGAAPPSGHGPHRYVIGVHALDVPSLDLGTDATATQLGFAMFGHTLARATLTPWFALD